MIKYDKYKPSEIDWIGDIPENWKSSSLKRICSKITDGAHTSPDLSSPDYPFLSVVNLKAGMLDFDNCHYTSAADYNYLVRNNCKPNRGDILFSKDGTIGETILIVQDIEFVVGSSFIIISPISRVIMSGYLNFFLKSSFIQDSARASLKGTGIPRLSIFNFGRLNVLMPSCREQTQIANYLDTKTQDIDKKINLLTQKANYYKEYRKSLINEKVCKGLDKNVNLKDSAIEWIGQIPEHWKILRGKNLFIEYNKSKITANEGNKKGRYKFFTSSNEQSKWLDYFEMDEEAILFSTGGSAGVNYCEKEYSYSTDCWAVKGNKKIHLKYYYYYYENI